MRFKDKGIGYRALVEKVGKEKAEKLRVFLNKPKLYWQTPRGSWVRGDSNIARTNDW